MQPTANGMPHLGEHTKLWMARMFFSLDYFFQLNLANHFSLFIYLT